MGHRGWRSIRGGGFRGKSSIENKGFGREQGSTHRPPAKVDLLPQPPRWACLCSPVDQAGLELVILPQPPQGWNSKCTPSTLLLKQFSGAQKLNFCKLSFKRKGRKTTKGFMCRKWEAVPAMNRVLHYTLGRTVPKTGGPIHSILACLWRKLFLTFQSWVRISWPTHCSHQESDPHRCPSPEVW